MKNYLPTSLLATCLATCLTICLTMPAYASPNKFVAKSPDQPLHGRAIMLCMVLLVMLHAAKRTPATRR